MLSVTSMSSNEKGMSSNEKGMSSNEKGMSSDEKGMSSDEKGMSSNEKGMSSDEKSGKVCVHCGLAPLTFPSDASKREFENITGICPICWHLTLAPTEADEIDENDMEWYNRDLGHYGFEFVMHSQLPHGLRCVKCKNLVSSLMRNQHKCAGTHILALESAPSTSNASNASNAAKSDTDSQNKALASSVESDKGNLPPAAQDILDP
jgi:hypothetical protein